MCLEAVHCCVASDPRPAAPVPVSAGTTGSSGSGSLTGRSWRRRGRGLSEDSTGEGPPCELTHRPRSRIQPDTILGPLSEGLSRGPLSRRRLLAPTDGGSRAGRTDRQEPESLYPNVTPMAFAFWSSEASPSPTRGPAPARPRQQEHGGRWVSWEEAGFAHFFFF